MIDRANLVLYFFGLRIVPTSFMDQAASILEENTRLRAANDSLRSRALVAITALNAIRLTLTSNSERCLHCQARRYDDHSRACPVRTATTAIAEATDAPVVNEKEMN